MSKNKYEVEIEETLTYKITVEADSEKQAEELAFASEDFCQNNHVENDAVATIITKVEE